MNILAIGAHPDDIEFGCGGSLIKYADKGQNIYLLVMSKGELGAEGNARATEQSDAAKCLGARDVFWGGLEDTHIDVCQETIQRIENVIKKVRPDLIFCHFSGDTHQDHRHLSQMTISATRYVPNVLFYEGPTTEGFNPQVFINIDGVMERKIEALTAHGSQIEKTNIKDVSILEIARSCAIFRGIQGRVKYAEAFRALRLFINI